MMGWPPSQPEWLDEYYLAADDGNLVMSLHHNIVLFSKHHTPLVHLRNGRNVDHMLATGHHRFQSMFVGHLHQSLDVYCGGGLDSHVST